MAEVYLYKKGEYVYNNIYKVDDRTVSHFPTSMELSNVINALKKKREAAHNQHMQKDYTFYEHTIKRHCWVTLSFLLCFIFFCVTPYYFYFHTELGSSYELATLLKDPMKGDIDRLFMILVITFGIFYFIAAYIFFIHDFFKNKNKYNESKNSFDNMLKHFQSMKRDVDFYKQEEDKLNKSKYHNAKDIKLRKVEFTYPKEYVFHKPLSWQGACDILFSACAIYIGLFFIALQQVPLQEINGSGIFFESEYNEDIGLKVIKYNHLKKEEFVLPIESKDIKVYTDLKEGEPYTYSYYFLTYNHQIKAEQNKHVQQGIVLHVDKDYFIKEMIETQKSP